MGQRVYEYWEQAQHTLLDTDNSCSQLLAGQGISEYCQTRVMFTNALAVI